MAGFLRKKIKADTNSTRSPAAAPANVPPPPPPLFARFASTTSESPVSHRMVSSPMLLSSAPRKDGPPAPLNGRGTGQGPRVADIGRRQPEAAAGRGARTQHPTSSGGVPPQALSPRQPSPEKTLRRVSRQPSPEKSLRHLSRPSTSPNPVATPPMSPETRGAPPTPNTPANRLRTMPVRDDKPLPQLFPEPNAPPRQAAEEVNLSDVRNMKRTSVISPNRLPNINVNPSLRTGYHESHRSPPHSQSAAPSSFNHPSGDRNPSSQTLTPRSSLRSLSHHDGQDSGAMERGSLLVDDGGRQRTDGQYGYAVGSRISHHIDQLHSRGSHEFTPEPVLYQGATNDHTFLPSPSSSPTSHRTLSKAKPRGYSPAPDTSISPPGNSAATSPPELIKGLYDHRLPPPQRRALPSAPSDATNPDSQWSPPQSPQKSPSVRSAHVPINRKPLIFAAMASVEPKQAEFVPSQPMINEWEISSSPPRGYPSPPAEMTRPPQFPYENGQFAASFSTVMSGSQEFTQYSSSTDDTPTPRLEGNRPLPQLAQPHLRTRKLSRPRTPVTQPPEMPASPDKRSHHRNTTKSRPTTPVSPHLPVKKLGPPLEHDGDVVGIPLDDDPFAKAEGVRMLKPSGSESTIKRPRTKDGLKKSSSRDALAAAAQQQTLDAVISNGNGPVVDPPKSPAVNAPLSPVSSDGSHQVRTRLLSGELDDIPPPVTTDAIVDEGSTPEPFPLALFLSEPHLLSSLLEYLSFSEWCILSGVSRHIRSTLVHKADLREEILERYLKIVGYARWMWDEPEPLSLSLKDLNDYMRGVSTSTYEYGRVADAYVQSLLIHPSNRDQSVGETVRDLTACTRAYTRVVLRLRAQAEKEAATYAAQRSRHGSPARPSASRASSRAPSPTQSSFSHSHHGHNPNQQQPPPPSRPTISGSSFRSPLFRLRRAPLLRVFVPSPDGDWLSDKSVLECEAECKRAGVLGLLRVGDVVWDVAVGDEGNVGRLVWDGSYLIDLDYTYSPVGDLPKYMPTLAFPPSYFHRVIRTGPSTTNPIVHIDLSPWGEEIAANLQLLQDRVRTETPQGSYHNVVRWVHRSSFIVRPLSKSAQRGHSPRSHPQTSRIPIPGCNGLFVDSGWYGTIVVETEGTNECLADLQDRCGPGAFPPRVMGVNGHQFRDRDSKKVFRILRERSRPGEIWIRTVGAKERLL